MENSVKHQITSARVYYLLSVCLGDLEPTYWRGASWVKETLIAHHLYTLALVLDCQQDYTTRRSRAADAAYCKRCHVKKQHKQ